METNRDNDSNETPAPPKLVAALRRAQSARVFVPPTVDEIVLRAARQHLAPATRRAGGRIWLWPRWPALGAACVVVAAMLYVFRNPPGTERSFAREDLNRDGRVDVLDAFQLARELRTGAKSSLSSDVNGDGIVDRRDAELIATQAVRLEKGGRS